MTTTMSRQQLAAAYLDLVGYDPFEDDPTITESEVAEMLLGYESEMAAGVVKREDADQ